MVVGFNHNFTYKGVVYHIQTEDGGLGSPNIITLLYHGGTILASRKTSYADITKADQLEKVVEELMKEQHKGMLRSLKNGEFDDVIARFQARTGQKVEATAPAAVEKVVATAPTIPKVAAAPPRQAVAPVPSRPEPAVTTTPTPGEKPSVKSAEKKPMEKKPTVAASLDEIVLSYLMGDEK